MALIIITLAALMSWQEEYTKKADIDHYTVFVYSPFLNYDFESQISDARLKLAPTRSAINGIAIKRKGLTYAFGYEEKNDRSSEQKTDFFDLQISYDYKRLLYTAYYQNYNGFYINDNNKININDKKDISSVSYGLEVKYFSKKTYSLAKMILNEEKSQASDDSFFHSLLINATKFKNSTNLFDSRGLSDFAGLSKMRAFNIGYEYGYTKTARFLWMHLTGIVALGYNIHYLDVDSDRGSRGLNSNISLSSGLDLGLYNNKKITAGVYSKLNSIAFTHEDTSITQTRASIILYFRSFF